MSSDDRSYIYQQTIPELPDGPWLTKEQTGLDRTSETWKKWRECCPILRQPKDGRPRGIGWQPGLGRTYLYSRKDSLEILKRIIPPVDRFRDLDGVVWVWFEAAHRLGYRTRPSVLFRWHWSGQKYPELNYRPEPRTMYVPKGKL